MEILTQASVERVFILTCCLILTPTITAPTEDLELNPENAAGVSRNHYPEDDSSDMNSWNYNFPRFSVSLQEKSPEAKRRSSFFPVRGKKVSQNVRFSNAKSESPVEYSVYPERASTYGRTGVFPVIAHRFYDVSHENPGDDGKFPNDPKNVLETEPDSLDLTGQLNWPQEEKRRSSFMPMRGRKRYTSGNNLQEIKGHLPTYGDSLGFAFKDVFSGDAVNKGSKEINENGNYQVTSKTFSSGKTMPSKRALSFVPTRGRREKYPYAFLLPVAVSHKLARWSEDFPSQQISTNFSQNMYEAEGKSHPRHRRASAFLPSRGRKSSIDPYWLAYNYLPQNVGQMHRYSDLGRRSDNIENMEHQIPEDEEMQREIYGEDVKYMNGRIQKRSFDGEGLLPSPSHQKLRTAIVMKRPLSFFAARGKRLNDDETDLI